MNDSCRIVSHTICLSAIRGTWCRAEVGLAYLLVHVQLPEYLRCVEKVLVLEDPAVSVSTSASALRRRRKRTFSRCMQAVGGSGSEQPSSHLSGIARSGKRVRLPRGQCRYSDGYKDR